MTEDRDRDAPARPPVDLRARPQPALLHPGRRPCALAAALSALVGGMCETDYSGYPDCRRDTSTPGKDPAAWAERRTSCIETPLM